MSVVMLDAALPTRDDTGEFDPVLSHDERMMLAAPAIRRFMAAFADPFPEPLVDALFALRDVMRTLRLDPVAVALRAREDYAPASGAFARLIVGDAQDGRLGG